MSMKTRSNGRSGETMKKPRSNAKAITRDQVYNALASLVFVLFILWAVATPFVNEQPTPAEAAPALPAIPSTVYCGTPKQSKYPNKKINVPNAEAGRRMAAKQGWTGREWEKLLELGACESSWNHLAKNSIGCYGIPQSCPADKMAKYGKDFMGRDYRTSPDIQLEFMADYIRDRYGSPSKAMEAHYRQNWY